MVFYCEQCGECCSHLGLVHSITEDHGNYEFVVFNLYTNESDVVTVDADSMPFMMTRASLSYSPRPARSSGTSPVRKGVLHGALHPP